MTLSAASDPPPLVGQSPVFQAMLEQVSRLAPLSKPVLVIGERGTGKELIAARLHYLSRRWDRPFIKLNCATLAETLLETELFGHEAGAFTGAVRRRIGRFELADGGTLFLDEIAAASPAVQEKILRVIEYGTFERVGGSRTIATDVRVIAATNVDLPSLAAAGRFRADLLDRLSFDVVTLPPLRARLDDIAILADRFAVDMTRDLGRPYFPGFTNAALDRLKAHDWPGNVRELKNVVERSVYRWPHRERPVATVVLDPFDSPFRPRPEPPPEPTPEPPRPVQDGGVPGPAVSGTGGLRDKVRAFEIDLLRAALERNRFNQRETAQDLGLTYDQLRGYLRKYRLP